MGGRCTPGGGAGAGQADMLVQVSSYQSSQCPLSTANKPAYCHITHHTLTTSPSPGTRAPTHILTAAELRDSGSLGDGPVHPLNEDPVASRHPAHLHSVPCLGDPQVANLGREGGEGREGRWMEEEQDRVGG